MILKSTTFLFLWLFAIQPLFAIETTYVQSKEDSLVLHKTKSERTIIIPSGRKIRVWSLHNDPLKGRFKSFTNDTLTITLKGIEHNFYVNDIEKIRYYRHVVYRALGLTVMGAGIATLTVGGFYTIVGIIGIINRSAIAIAIIPALPTMLLGTGIYRIGSHLRGKSFNLNRNWKITNPSIH